MNDAIVRPMITAEQIAARVRELGEQISQDYSDRRLVLVCVLKGSFVFTADLARSISTNLRSRTGAFSTSGFAPERSAKMPTMNGNSSNCPTSGTSNERN